MQSGNICSWEVALYCKVHFESIYSGQDQLMWLENPWKDLKLSHTHANMSETPVNLSDLASWQSMDPHLATTGESCHWCRSLLWVSALHYSARSQVLKRFQTAASARALHLLTIVGLSISIVSVHKFRTLFEQIIRGEHRVKSEAKSISNIWKSEFQSYFQYMEIRLWKSEWCRKWPEVE